jgi:hypothetical protein
VHVVAYAPEDLGCSGNVNSSDKDKNHSYMDHPPSFSVTIHYSYAVPMAADRQIQEVQEATVLQSRDYTKDGVKVQINLKPFPFSYFLKFIFSLETEG